MMKTQWKTANVCVLYPNDDIKVESTDTGTCFDFREPAQR